MGSVLREFWLFLKQEKKWWLVPMLLIVGLVGVFVLLAHVFPAFAPFVYSFV